MGLFYPYFCKFSWSVFGPSGDAPPLYVTLQHFRCWGLGKRYIGSTGRRNFGVHIIKGVTLSLTDQRKRPGDDRVNSLSKLRYCEKILLYRGN